MDEINRVKDCVVNIMFADTNDPEWYRNEYCWRFCNHRCVKDMDYKRAEANKKYY